MALSSAQVFPEWLTGNLAVHVFSVNGDHPLYFLSHARGSLHSNSLPYTPSSAILLAPLSPRVDFSYPNPLPVIVDFGSPVSKILVFLSIDHVGFNWDAFQYSIWGYNGSRQYGTYHLLYDPTSVNAVPINNSGVDLPFTLGPTWLGQAPTLINNHAKNPPQGAGGWVGYQAYFDFSANPNTSFDSAYVGAYRFYMFRPSTFVQNSKTGEIEAEIAAVAAAVPCSSFVEICKSSSSVNPVSGNFTFTSPSFANPVTVPVGSCSGPVLVPPGNVAITEGIHPPQVVLNSVAASGYNPMTFQLENRLGTTNLPVGTATVTAVPGGVPFETVANFTNQGPTGNLKICKIAGPGIAVGRPFNFTVTSTGNPATTYTVPAGPAAEGGYFVLDSTTFPLGTKVTVAETVPLIANLSVSSVVSPGGTTGHASIVATLGTGLTEVTLTNTVSGAVIYNPNVLNFAEALPTPAPPQTITLSNTPPVGFTAAASISLGPAGWLAVSPSQGTTPATLNVTVSATVPVGTYTGAITISSPGAADEIVPVTYVVSQSVPNATSVGNGASFTQSFTPGMLMSVFGTGLSSGDPQTVSVAPLPLTSSSGTTVTIGGIPAPLLYISATQINLQIPYEVPVGNAVLTVNSGGLSASINFTIQAAAPGIFVDSSNGAIAGNETAAVGSTIGLYATGVGLVTPPEATGNVPVAGTVPVPNLPVTVTVGGVTATTVFVGIPNWSVGTLQVNFIVPLTVATGSQPVVVTVGGVPSKPAMLNVTAAGQ